MRVAMRQRKCRSVNENRWSGPPVRIGRLRDTVNWDYPQAARRQEFPNFNPPEASGFLLEDRITVWR